MTQSNFSTSNFHFVIVKCGTFLESRKAYSFPLLFCVIRLTEHVHRVSETRLDVAKALQGFAIGRNFLLSGRWSVEVKEWRRDVFFSIRRAYLSEKVSRQETAVRICTVHVKQRRDTQVAGCRWRMNWNRWLSWADCRKS